MFAFAVLTLLFSSCKDDINNVGLGIQPEEDLLSIQLDSLDFQVNLYRADSIKASGAIVFPQIGTYTDPIFGTVRRELYSQLELPGSNLDLGNPDSLEIDSVVLVLQSTQRHYGTLLPQELTVTELANDIYADSTYYSNSIIPTLTENLIEPSFEVVPVSDGNLFNNGDSVNTEIRIKLKNSLGQLFIDQYDQEPLESSENFQDFFKGVSIKSSSLNGGLVSVFPSGLSSGIFVYYRDNGVVLDTLDVLFPFNNSSAFSTTTHDYTSTPFGNLDIPAEANNLIHIQGIEGTLAHVEITNLSNLNITDITGLNRAELIVPVLNNSTLSYAPPSVLYMLGSNDEESSEFITDMCSGLGTGGFYDSDLEAYVFNITLHLIEMIEGNAVPEFWFLPNIPSNINLPDACPAIANFTDLVNPFFLDERRVVLCGPNFSSQDSSQNMRITVTYSE